MPTYRLVARVEADAAEGTSFTVRSPAVGVADRLPAVGVYLNPLQGFFTLTILGRRYVVQLPRNVQGRVTEQHVSETYVPVGFDQPLVELSLVAEAEQGGAAAGVAIGGARSLAIDADLIPIQAPSEGVFYRKPSPDSPTYVDVGSEVTSGTVLGLVEVMKSFNQITYGGPGLPERGVVVQIMTEDAEEVAYGQTLLLVRPA